MGLVLAVQVGQLAVDGRARRELDDELDPLTSRVANQEWRATFGQRRQARRTFELRKRWCARLAKLALFEDDGKQ